MFCSEDSPLNIFLVVLHNGEFYTVVILLVLLLVFFVQSMKDNAPSSGLLIALAVAVYALIAFVAAGIFMRLVYLVRGLFYRVWDLVVGPSKNHLGENTLHRN